MSHIDDLKAAIYKIHGAKATHRESVPVHETWQGKTIWDGVVEVFDLKGHPKTHRAYAWSHDTDDPKQPKRHVTVLHIPPAISPQTAVQAAIMQEIQSHARTQA
jgi:hypothetical protein